MKHIIKQNRYLPTLLLLLAIVSVAFTGCDLSSPAASTASPQSSTSATVATATDSPVEITPTASGVDMASATSITLNNTQTTIEGAGAALSGSNVVISQGGTYLLSGSLAGQILIEAPKTTDVYLVLDGVDINADTNAAIYAKQADNLFVILADGSTNTVADAVDFVYADTAAEEPDATIFSKVDMSFSGGGALAVTANFYNGIGTKDDLVIESGAYTITAANHGLRGRDSLTIQDGDFTIISGNDGIQSNNDEDVSRGWVTIHAGQFDITAAHDGIQAETALTISDGSFTVLAGGGRSSAIVLDSATDSDSYKALKAGGNVSITGGEFTLDSADDTVHSNQNIAITGGIFTLSSGDDGIHADGELTVDAGTINIEASYEGIEASLMNLNGGDIRLVAEDDGINVAGGTTDESDTTAATAPQGRFGGDSFAGNSNRWLYINGGTITVLAEGDGIDVNGNTKMTGGSVYVSGPVSSGNGALDYDGTFEVEGGTLIAAGSSGMAMTPSEGSTQPSLMIYFSASQPTGTNIALKNSTGEVVASYSPEKQFRTMMLCAPGLALNEAYTLFSDDSELSTITLSAAITTVSETGEAVSAPVGFGGGGFGGERPGGGMRPESEPPAPPAAPTA